MGFSYSEERRFHDAMRGDYTLANIVEYISKTFDVDEIFEDSTLKYWCSIHYVPDTGNREDY